MGGGGSQFQANVQPLTTPGTHAYQNRMILAVRLWGGGGAVTEDGIGNEGPPVDPGDP